MVKRNGGPWVGVAQVFSDAFLDVAEVGVAVGVWPLFDVEVDDVVVFGVVVVKFIGRGNGVIYLLVHHQTCLVGPASRHVFYRVATTTQKDQRHIEALHETEALAMPFDGQVQATKFVPRQRISPTLDDHDIWTEAVHRALHDSFEEIGV